MSEPSTEFELVSNILFSGMAGLFLFAWCYDMFLDPMELDVFLGGLLVLGFFTFYPLSNAIHWYREIKKPETESSLDTHEVRTEEKQ